MGDILKNVCPGTAYINNLVACFIDFLLKYFTVIMEQKEVPNTKYFLVLQINLSYQIFSSGAVALVWVAPYHWETMTPGTISIRSVWYFHLNKYCIWHKVTITMRYSSLSKTQSKVFNPCLHRTLSTNDNGFACHTIDHLLSIIVMIAESWMPDLCLCVSNRWKMNSTLLWCYSSFPRKWVLVSAVLLQPYEHDWANLKWKQ